MGILDGLEKFGLKTEEGRDLFANDKKEEVEEKVEEPEEKIPTEEEFLLDKTITCIVCDKKFKTKMVKSGRARRMQPDEDLRPRFQYIDTMKYGVTVCPHCGYAALDNQFIHITAGQRKLIKEGISAQFKEDLSHQGDSIYDYETALDRHKLALLSTIVKKGKTSERAYICLKSAWLYRAYAEQLEDAVDPDTEKITECRQNEEEYYKEAFDGFMKAIATEGYPMCGMEQTTVNYLLAYMAFHFKRYELSARFIADIITSTTASHKMKELTLELKQHVLQEIRTAKH